MHWYCKYGISYQERLEMLADGGVNLVNTTIYRWIQRYAPKIEKRLCWYRCSPSDLNNWHLNGTYIKVNGKWTYLYRAVDSRVHSIEFYLSPHRNTKAAYRFLRKIFNRVRNGKSSGLSIQIKPHLIVKLLTLSKKKENALHM